MDVSASILLGAAGLTAGFYTPKAVRLIVDRKRRAKDMPPAPEEGFAPLLRFLICLLDASVWALAGLFAGNAAAALFASILFATAVAVALVDLRIRLIPNELVLVLAAAGIAYQIAGYGLRALPGALLCMLGMMALFGVAAGFVGFGKVGAGDVKLAGAMGLALGYPNIVVALLVLCAALLFYSLSGLLIGKLTLKSMLPFGPFMTAGMAAALICAVFRIAPNFLATL